MIALAFNLGFAWGALSAGVVCLLVWAWRGRRL